MTTKQNQKLGRVTVEIPATLPEITELEQQIAALSIEFNTLMAAIAEDPGKPKYGDDFTPQAWSVVMDKITLKLAALRGANEAQAAYDYLIAEVQNYTARRIAGLHAGLILRKLEAMQAKINMLRKLEIAGDVQSPLYKVGQQAQARRVPASAVNNVLEEFDDLYNRAALEIVQRFNGTEDTATG